VILIGVVTEDRSVKMDSVPCLFNARLLLIAAAFTYVFFAARASADFLDEPSYKRWGNSGDGAKNSSAPDGPSSSKSNVRIDLTPGSTIFSQSDPSPTINQISPGLYQPQGSSSPGSHISRKEQPRSMSNPNLYSRQPVAPRSLQSGTVHGAGWGSMPTLNRMPEPTKPKPQTIMSQGGGSDFPLPPAADEVEQFRIPQLDDLIMRAAYQPNRIDGSLTPPAGYKKPGQK